MNSGVFQSDGLAVIVGEGAGQAHRAEGASQAIVFYNQAYSGKILAPVQLTGPADGATIDTNGAVLSCAPLENAVRYQLLFGADPDRVMDFAVMSDSTNPPTQTVSTVLGKLTTGQFFFGRDSVEILAKEPKK